MNRSSPSELVGVVDQLGAFVVDDGFRLLEVHAVLLEIGGGLAFVPLEVQCVSVRLNRSVAGVQSGDTQLYRTHAHGESGKGVLLQLQRCGYAPSG